MGVGGVVLFMVVWFFLFVFVALFIYFFFFLEDLFADEGWIESLLYCTSILLNKNACLTDDCYNRTQK